MTTLQSFVVNRKLTIKNIHIDPKKIKATYCVQNMSGEISSFDFIYSYEHAYFDKKTPQDVNLASMMLAQVAINYGLFFETIEYDGLFDKTDKRFIIDMTENTSREILCNKLLIKNEFLKPPFDHLTPPKRDRYTQADIIFSNTQFKNLRVKEDRLETDFNKYAILSSGGKDSLLTYGIIKEIGTPYPVFINEAGRHWFTAVNSYRHFKEIEQNTEKPWCNSDRVFNWMLKQMPFIKENYSNIRADIYPVRLWTVAVFLFGTLPIVRKKGIGNIIIGNEYDTTVRGRLHGISHYNALYDQSKYFDNNLSRYYKKKNWGIYQYSLLRSLSELLIMKTLISRYPDLQKHQISCHAAHESGGRMYPCGKCEKCRRVIGMIKALGESPENCGYSKAQVADALHALANKSVKQFGIDASHLYYLLLSNDLVERNEFTVKAAKRHDEIMKLRFDRERSNLEDLPEYVRQPLFAILVQYADGAVQISNRKIKGIHINDTFINEKKYILNEK